MKLADLHSAAAAAAATATKTAEQEMEHIQIQRDISHAEQLQSLHESESDVLRAYRLYSQAFRSVEKWNNSVEVSSRIL